MVRHAQKVAERRVFNLVYDSSHFAEVDPSEKPDFLVRFRDPQRGVLGVELTDLYPSESDARALNIPDYVPDLLDGGLARHKVDRAELKVEDVTVIRGDGSTHKIRAIMRRMPSFTEHTKALAERVLKKGASVQIYRQQCDVADLVIRVFFRLRARFETRFLISLRSS